MMKKTSPFRLAFFLMLAAGVLCLASCKSDSDDLPSDPHFPLFNPFIGVWKDDADTYWQFRTDGTGGRAETEEGPFPDDFSFFVYAGQDVLTAPPNGNLVILDGTTTITVTRYEFAIAGNHAALINKSEGANKTLEKISGSPHVLSLTNPLIGELSADWSDIHGLRWSIKYRADGTVKTYHHQVRHQFENAYALRENTLVIFGGMRFSINPVIAEITSIGSGRWQVIETQSSPAPAQWVYTKVIAAEWLD
jgi:hypothetical protein